MPIKRKSKSEPENVATLFGVDALEDGEDSELASDVRDTAAAFLEALKGTASKSVAAAFWDERAVARGEKKKPKQAPEEPVVSKEERKLAKKERLRERLLEQRTAEREARKAGRATAAGKKQAASQSTASKKPRGNSGLFDGDDAMWDD
jgi:hypothetical protein